MIRNGFQTLTGSVWVIVTLFTMLIAGTARAVVPVPAADQSEPIAVIGAIIHVGDGTIIKSPWLPGSRYRF